MGPEASVRACRRFTVQSPPLDRVHRCRDARRKQAAGAAKLADARGTVDLAATTLCFVHDAERAMAEMARVLRPGGQLVIGELGFWSLWAAHRRIRGWLGNSIWRAAVFRTAKDLRGLAQAAGLTSIKVRGAIHYPPFSLAAKLLAPVDLLIGQHATFGSAFLALTATKPAQMVGQRGHEEPRR
jgi:SAM-dependent methyltransferase